MFRTILAGLLLLAASSKSTHATEATGSRDVSQVVPEIAARVVQVFASDGSVTNAGSAVLLGADLAVTNCHVVSGMETVGVALGIGAVEATIVVRNTYLDLCLLRLHERQGLAVVRRSSFSVAAGEPSYAVGFAQGRLGLSRGPVGTRYLMQGGFVLRTGAGFLAGASGGGLFDTQGRLIGILTFYRRSPDVSMYFAVPVEWVDELLVRVPPSGKAAPIDVDSREPFWNVDVQKTDRQRPRFLDALVLEADGRWDDLASFAQDWLEAAPGDEGASATLTLARLRRAPSSQ